MDTWLDDTAKVSERCSQVAELWASGPLGPLSTGCIGSNEFFPPPHPQGRQNISPDKIPWSALKTLMAQSIYGGRVDNEFDQRLLNTFLERLFTTKSFDSEFKLACKVDGHKDIQMPDGIR